MKKITSQEKNNKKIFKGSSFFLVAASLFLCQSAQAGAIENYYIFQSNVNKNGAVVADSFLPVFFVKGFNSKTRNKQHEGFKGYAQGAEAAAFVRLSDSFTAGLGYAHTTVSLKPKGAKSAINGDSFFVSGKYQPEKWYISAKALANHSRYKDKFFTAANARADMYRGELFSGYEMGDVHNYSGIKYTSVHPVHQKADMLHTAPRHNSELITAVIGTQYAHNYQLGSNTSLKPNGWLSGNYDVKSSNAQTVVDVPETSAFYVVNKHRLHRASLDAGIGLSATYKNVELSLGYGVNWRVSQFSQTGKASVLFKF